MQFDCSGEFALVIAPVVTTAAKRALQILIDTSSYENIIVHRIFNFWPEPFEYYNGRYRAQLLNDRSGHIRMTPGAAATNKTRRRR